MPRSSAGAQEAVLSRFAGTEADPDEPAVAVRLATAAFDRVRAGPRPAGGRRGWALTSGGGGRVLNADEIPREIDIEDVREILTADGPSFSLNHARLALGLKVTW